MKTPVAPTMPPTKVAEQIAKNNGNRDLSKIVQDPSRNIAKRGGK